MLFPVRVYDKTGKLKNEYSSEYLRSRYDTYGQLIDQSPTKTKASVGVCKSCGEQFMRGKAFQKLCSDCKRVSNFANGGADYYG